MNKEEILRNIYYNSFHPASFGGYQKLYNYAKKLNQNITLNDVKSWLSSQQEYTLFKETKNNFKRNRIYSSYANQQWEIDILDLSQYSRYNRIRIHRNNRLELRSIKYLITIIDIFSKYAYVMPIELKSMKIICENFEKLFKLVKPQKIRSDRGLEFDNIQFRLLCEKNNIKFFTTQNSTKKCAIIERFNKTLRTKIERYMNYRRTRRYVDHLKSFVTAYNHSMHKSIKMAPIDVSYDKEPEVFKNLYGKKNLLEILKENRLKNKFSVGDNVRLKYERKIFDKGYRQKWTDIVYKVKKILNKLTKSQLLLEYRGQVLKRRFYPEELQKVEINHNTVWGIEKVLRKRVKNNKVELFVKWKGFPPEESSWIPAESVQKT